MTKQRETIRDLNDRFRALDQTIPGRIMITSGVQHLIAEHNGFGLNDVVRAVQAFDKFDKDNDPYGQHYYGAFDFLNRRLFWKIDYYAPNLQHGSEDPADLTKTVRVLTIMLAEEY